MEEENSRLKDTILMLKWELEKERKKVKVSARISAGNDSKGPRTGDRKQ